MPTDHPYRLTASNVARYFKHQCDRLFRWDAVPSRARGRKGIGWDVPTKKRSYARPGIQLLMEGGDEFERDELQALIDREGEDKVHLEGFETRGGREVVESTSLDQLRDVLQNGPPKFIAQVEIALPPAAEARVLTRFGLDPDRVALGTARPDLIEVVESDDGPLLRVWDYKASQAARHEHFIQVAFYTMLLEEALVATGIDAMGYAVDTNFGVVRSRQDEPEEFELAPYRLAIADFLRNRAPELMATAAAEAHYHVCAGCLVCEYVHRCQDEADASRDLSRVPYITSESKRKLLAAGIRDHRDLARLDIDGEDEELAADLRDQSHDLSVNLTRYVALARSLADGEPRPLEAQTLQVPRWEDVRVVLSAEQDAVTATCFALGLSTYEGWDAEAGKVRGREHIFVAEEEDTEAEILLAFLKALNGLLQEVHEHNRSVNATPLDDEPDVRAALDAHEAAEAALDDFKEEHPRLHRHLPDVETLKAEREGLQATVKAAKGHVDAARREAGRERWKKQKRLHFYVYDNLDLLALKGAVERHLFSDSAELQAEIRSLVRLFPPESVLPDADTFRTIPGTVVVQALRQLVALPSPYLYDLETVSKLYRPRKSDGSEGGWSYRPRYGFGYEHSNQVAFERIHDVWQGDDFVTKSGGTMSPAEILAQIEKSVQSKLWATDSVVQRLKQLHDAQEEATGMGALLLRKEPFQLYQDFDPADPELEIVDALNVFALLEASLDEMQTKHLHTLPVADRAAKFEAISGLRYLEGLDDEDGAMWFEFDAACRDTKFSEGDFNLVLTEQDNPQMLLGDIDAGLFGDNPYWRYADFKVTLKEFDLSTSPPRVKLSSRRPDKLKAKVDFSRTLVLDKLYADYTTKRVLDLLGRLKESPGDAREVADILRHGTIADWEPFIDDDEEHEHAFREMIARTPTGDGALDPDDVLNAGQWAAWKGVTQAPVSLVWGPPGTGKTYTVAHVLIGYAMAAKRLGRPLRILTTAFTHHAIVTVLEKVIALKATYGLSDDDLAVAKVGRVNSADDRLNTDDYERISDGSAVIERALSETPQCLVMGATVWSVHKTIEAADEPGWDWFDVVLVDEASQLRLPDALIAMATAKPNANIILSGDDQQLPPIIRGTYPEEHEPVLTSVFAFVRHKAIERDAETPGEMGRTLFQLIENFRMNEPLTAYPREVIYGEYESAQPERRVSLADSTGDEALDLVLAPEAPAVLVWYTPPRSFTARNQLEALLAAQIVEALAEVLICPGSEEPYDAEGLARDGVAVLAPHRAQNATIRSALAEAGFGDAEKPMPLVDTVEKLQGKEREVIVVSYGVADAEYADAEADFLLSRNRFNVAATRAQSKLIVLCSDTVLDAVPTDRHVLLESMMLKEFRSYCADGYAAVTWPHPDFGDIELHVQWKEFDAAPSTSPKAALGGGAA